MDVSSYSKDKKAIYNSKIEEKKKKFQVKGNVPQIFYHEKDVARIKGKTGRFERNVKFSR